MFQLNDKIVCVNDDFRNSVFGIPGFRFRNPQGLPRKGGIYCVTGTYPGEMGTQGLFLAGLPTFLDGRQIGWNSTRFRKVQPRKHTAASVRRARVPASAPVGA